MRVQLLTIFVVLALASCVVGFGSHCKGPECETHGSITQLAFDSFLEDHPDVVIKTAKKDGVTGVVKSNQFTDKNILTRPEIPTGWTAKYHYMSGTIIKASNMILKDLENIKSLAVGGKGPQKENNLEAALRLYHIRYVLGRSLHMLQDLYAHSNWIEMHPLDDELALLETISSVPLCDLECCLRQVTETKNGKTVTFGEPVGHCMCSAYGYGRPKSACTHGKIPGIIDLIFDLQEKWGINKDDSNFGDDGVRYWFHKPAADRAVVHSKVLLEQIFKSVEAKYGHVYAVDRFKQLIYNSKVLQGTLDLHTTADNSSVSYVSSLNPLNLDVLRDQDEYDVITPPTMLAGDSIFLSFPANKLAPECRNAARVTVQATRETKVYPLATGKECSNTISGLVCFTLPVPTTTFVIQPDCADTSVSYSFTPHPMWFHQQVNTTMSKATPGKVTGKLAVVNGDDVAHACKLMATVMPDAGYACSVTPSLRVPEHSYALAEITCTGQKLTTDMTIPLSVLLSTDTGMLESGTLLLSYDSDI